MNKPTDIDSILLANWYFVNCVDCNEESDVVRKYLTTKINQTLNKRKKLHKLKSNLPK